MVENAGVLHDQSHRHPSSRSRRRRRRLSRRSGAVQRIHLARWESRSVEGIPFHER